MVLSYYFTDRLYIFLRPDQRSFRQRTITFWFCFHSIQKPSNYTIKLLNLRVLPNIWVFKDRLSRKKSGSFDHNCLFWRSLRIRKKSLETYLFNMKNLAALLIFRHSAYLPYSLHSGCLAFRFCKDPLRTMNINGIICLWRLCCSPRVLYKDNGNNV